MATLPFEYWTIGSGLLLLALLTFAGWYLFSSAHIHSTKFKE